MGLASQCPTSYSMVHYIILLCSSIISCSSSLNQIQHTFTEPPVFSPGNPASAALNLTFLSPVAGTGNLGISKFLGSSTACPATRPCKRGGRCCRPYNSSNGRRCPTKC